MICWRCHINSVDTGRRLPSISDVKTRKRRNVVGIDMIRNNRIVSVNHANNNLCTSQNALSRHRLDSSLWFKRMEVMEVKSLIWAQKGKLYIIYENVMKWNTTELISNGDLFQPHLKYTFKFFHICRSRLRSFITTLFHSSVHLFLF
jgi:hypothetical protein